MPGPVRSRMPTSLTGYVAERLVEVYTILSANGRLTSFKPGSDVDHKDLIIDERGGNRNLYEQVKCATHLNPKGRIICNARYHVGEIPDSPRLIYVPCYLDPVLMDLARIYFVPAPDFNRFAIRSMVRPGIIQLQFNCQSVGRDRRWSPYEIEKKDLGPRCLDVIEKAPPDGPLKTPGLLLFLRR